MLVKSVRKLYISSASSVWNKIEVKYIPQTSFKINTLIILRSYTNLILNKWTSHILSWSLGRTKRTRLAVNNVSSAPYKYTHKLIFVRVVRVRIRLNMTLDFDLTVTMSRLSYITRKHEITELKYTLEKQYCTRLCLTAPALTSF